MTNPKPRDSPPPFIPGCPGCLQTVQSTMVPNLLKAFVKSGVVVRKLPHPCVSRECDVTWYLTILHTHVHVHVQCRRTHARNTCSWPSSASHVPEVCDMKRVRSFLATIRVLPLPSALSSAVTFVQCRKQHQAVSCCCTSKLLSTYLSKVSCVSASFSRCCCVCYVVDLFV